LWGKLWDCLVVGVGGEMFQTKDRVENCLLKKGCGTGKPP